MASNAVNVSIFGVIIIAFQELQAESLYYPATYQSQKIILTWTKYFIGNKNHKESANRRHDQLSRRFNSLIRAFEKWQKSWIQILV